MTRAEIRTALDQTGLYYDPDHPDHISADKIVSLPPPFMEWGTEDIRIRADGIDYIRNRRLIVRVYTDTDEDTIVSVTGAEKTIEEVLEDIAGSFTKEIAYNYDLSLYETTYTLEV